MMNRRRAWKITVIAAMVAFLAAASPVAADERINEQTVEQAAERPAEQNAEQESEQAGKKKERKWRMRLMIAAVGDGGFALSSGGNHGDYVGTRGGGGVGINFEYRYSPKMGFEMGALALASNVGVWAKRDYYHDWGSVGLESFVPLTFALNYHPLKKTEVFDLFVGPLVSTTFYSNIGVGSAWGGAGVQSGVNIGLGVSLGADLNLGKSRWSLNAGLKYLALTGGGNSDIDLDPLMMTFGVGFKF